MHTENERKKRRSKSINSMEISPDLCFNWPLFQSKKKKIPHQRHRSSFIVHTNVTWNMFFLFSFAAHSPVWIGFVSGKLKLVFPLNNRFFIFVSFLPFQTKRETSSIASMHACTLCYTGSTLLWNRTIFMCICLLHRSKHKLQNSNIIYFVTELKMLYKHLSPFFNIS